MTDGQPYWRDVGTIDAYWEANLELTHVTPALNLYDQAWPIWTYQEQLPPAKFVFDIDGRRGAAIDSMVSGGCIISGSTVTTLAPVLERARAQLLHDRASRSSCPRSRSGRGAVLRRVVVDQGARIPPGLQRRRRSRGRPQALPRDRTRASPSSRRRCSGSSCITCASRWRESGDLSKVRRLLPC